MQSEKQYIDLYGSCRDMLFSHSADVMNAVRDSAFADFSRQGFPTRKVERYKYTDMQALFAPDYALPLHMESSYPYFLMCDTHTGKCRTLLQR